jgi:hypothetical protein
LTAGRVGHTIASAHEALKGLITSFGQNCPKTPLLSYYQGEMTC